MTANHNAEKINQLIVGGVLGFGFGAILASILCIVLGEYEPDNYTTAAGEVRTADRLTNESLVNYLAMPLILHTVAGMLLGYLCSQREIIAQSVKNTCIKMFNQNKDMGQHDNSNINFADNRAKTVA